MSAFVHPRSKAARDRARAVEIRRLRQIFGATVQDPAVVALDCSYSRAHRPRHFPHPSTGRMVCPVCHPTPGGAA